MTMASMDWLSTREIAGVFAEEVAEVGGSVTDRFDDGARLYLRSVLPGKRAVGYRDMVQGGIALRATGEEIWVHPYVFREVCKNGAIIAQATETRHIEQDILSDASPIETLREAIRACSCPEAFDASAREMETARSYQVDVALMLGVMLSRLPSAASEIQQAIIRQLFESRDRSAFGLINAVTAVARDTRDPELRWRLEEFGGGVPALARDPQPRPDRLNARVLAEA
jgi:hypothetical protein